MCVAVKKKLQLYYWKDREFHELQVKSDLGLTTVSSLFIIGIVNVSSFVHQGDFAAPDIPKSMAWCENSICVGFKRDYCLIRVCSPCSIIYSVF